MTQFNVYSNDYIIAEGKRDTPFLQTLSQIYSVGIVVKRFFFSILGLLVHSALFKKGIFVW